MIYIEKEGLDSTLNIEINKLKNSDKWKNILPNDTKAIRNFFDDEYPKKRVKEVLIREQHGLCAYCMRRISDDGKSKVEHIVPLSKNKEKAIDYNNMLCVCDGGEHAKHNDTDGVLTCDSAKGNREDVTISPLNKTQMEKITYNSEGEIVVYPFDKDMNDDIKDKLNLNGKKMRDGHIRDTVTGLLKNRRDAYRRARMLVIKLGNSNKCTSSKIRQIIDTKKSKPIQDEFVGVELFYLEKKYHSLVRRGK